MPGRAPNQKRAIEQALTGLQEAGVTHLARVKKKPSSAIAPPIATEAEPTSPPRAASPRQVAPRVAPLAASTTKSAEPAALPRDQVPSPAVSPAERLPALLTISSEVAACTRCQELADTRTQTVFGVGDPNARLVFMGEAPGADEDRQGEPFVGRAGQLLTKIIEACTLRREDVYILNTLKCRPPGNRTPLPEEVENCRGYLDRQLAVIRPKFICCLGAVAARTLLETTAPIGKLRKQFFEFRGSQVLCTYHPSYLLRNPPAKKDVWEDMQLLMQRMGIRLPSR